MSDPVGCQCAAEEVIDQSGRTLDLMGLESDPSVLRANCLDSAAQALRISLDDGYETVCHLSDCVDRHVFHLLHCVT